MKKYFVIKDEIFIIVTILSVIVLVCGVFSIDYFLNKYPNEVENNEEDTSEVIYEDEINLLDEKGDFKRYYISVQDTSFSAELESLTIDVEEETMSINSEEVLVGGYPTKHLSFYGDNVIIPFVYKDVWYGGFIIYNTSNGKHNIVDRIDDKYIYNHVDTFTSTSDGILLEVSLVDGNKIYIDDLEQDVCSIKKSKKTKVQESIFVKYNTKKKKIDFEKFEVVSSISLESYRVSNDLC